MAGRTIPNSEDRVEANRIALAGIAAGDGANVVASRLEPLHPKNDSFPAEVLLDLAADAIEEAGASRERPLQFERIRERFLPESRARTKAHHQKAEFAIRAAAMVRAGVDPDLLGEMVWSRTDDLWLWSFDALVVYVRAAAEHLGTTAPVICVRIASRYGIELSPEP